MASESPNAVRKVVIHLRATGDAPILKQQKFKVSGTDRFASVIDFLCRQLHRDTLFVYINSAFSPNPDESVIDLYNVPCWVADGYLALISNCFRILESMVSWLSIMLVPWRGADFDSYAAITSLNHFTELYIFCCYKVMVEDTTNRENLNRIIS